MPFCPHSSRAAGTAAAGITITARSTSPGMSFTDGYAFTPRIVSALGFTG